MKHLNKILVPTDLSEDSRRGLQYACTLAAEDKAALTVLYVANEFAAWELCCDELAFVDAPGRTWPVDRVLSEATLELNRFLERHLEMMKRIPCVTKRVVLGPVAQQIATVAEEDKADLVVMSPRRRRGFRSLITGGITGKVTRMSPCPVLSITPPLPSRPWRGKIVSLFLGWPRQSAANV